MPEPLDKALYDKIKKEVYAAIPKHSLFRSAQVVKKYKEAGGRYAGPKSRHGIDNWFKAKWISINDLYYDKKIVPCGSSNTYKKYKEYPLCRPLAIANKLKRSDMRKMLTAKNKLGKKQLRTRRVLGTRKYNVTEKYT